MNSATVAVLPAALPDLRALAYYGALYGVLVAVAAWIYRDARERGRRPRRAAAWAGATLVFSILTVLLYLYLRGRSAGRSAAERGPGDAADGDDG